MKRNTMCLVVVLGILLFGSLGLSGAGRVSSLMANDPDGDGVPDPLDLCPQVNASFFDRNGDGCIDDASGARHTEFWIAADMPFTYYINASGASGIDDGSDFEAIENAMNVWASIPDVEFSVSYGGTVAQKVAGALDLLNLVTFEDHQYNFPGAVLAVGISTSFTVDSLHQGVQYRAGQIVDADMMFNPARAFKTQTAGQQGIDIQSVATHEAGHLFGIAHSPVRTSTMFYVLPPGTGAATLEDEDELIFFKAYAGAAALAGANRISGTVESGIGAGGPVPGAIVYAIDAASGDTVAADYTLPDGSYTFLGMEDGSYHIAIHALDGTSAIGYLEPRYINALVETTAVTLFPPEYYDQNESATDDAADKTAVAVSGGSTASGIDLVTNIDSTHPTVVNLTPANNTGSVQIDAAVMIRFSESIDDESLSGNFSLRDAATNDFITGKATFLKDDSIIAFTPTLPFQFDRLYNLTLGEGIKDKSGLELTGGHASSFTTETMPPLAITSLAPSKGVVGNLIIINGVGFSRLPADHSVDFNGTPAEIAAVYRNRLLVRVPMGATTGLVTVKVGEAVSNGLTFTILSETEVARGFESGIADLGATPRSITVLPNGGYAYVATDEGVSAVVVDPGIADYLTVTSIPVSGGLDATDVTADGKLVYGVSRLNKKLYAIDADSGHGDLFNTVIAEHSFAVEPLGICIDASRGWAFIPLIDGEIQIWDVRRESATFETQIGVINPPVAVRGTMAVDPSAEHLFALSAGKMYVYDIGPDTLSAEVPVLQDPQDVIVDPAGTYAYVSDGTGNVTVIPLAALSNLPIINTGGSLRGMVITPGGGYLYACNDQLKFIDVIDLNQASGTFRSVAATIDVEANPVDIDLSPDGFYAYSVVRDMRQLVVTTIGLGPTIKSLSRRAGPVGTRVVVSGTGFGVALDSIRVEFAGNAGVPVQVVPEYSSGTSLTVSVPSAAASGPVRVLTASLEGSSVEWKLSNALYFQVLSPGGHGGLRLAARASLQPGGHLNPSLELSPTGDFLVVAGDMNDISGTWNVFDTDPGSATFNQFINTTAVMDYSPGYIALTPDGERGYLGMSQEHAIWCVNVNRHSRTFGKPLDMIDLAGTGVSSFTSMKISPDGELLILGARFVDADSVYVIDIVPGSNTENAIIGRVGSAMGIEAVDIAFHPAGRYAYIANWREDAIDVLCLDPTSPDYMRIVAAVSVAAGPWGQEPFSISFEPSGARCHVLVRQNEVWFWGTIVIDTSNPALPVEEEGGGVGFGCYGTQAQGTIDVSPVGDRLLAAVGHCGYYSIDLLADPDSLFDTIYDNSLSSTVDMDFTPDGSRVYVAGPYQDSIFVYDFNAANNLYMVSGDEQSGVINTPLTAPLRVRAVTTAAPILLPVPGVPITFTVTGGGGHFTESGLTTQVLATDQDGYAEIDWTLGGVVGVQTQFVQAVALGLVGSPLQFVADSYDDPGNLPLQITETLPLNGTIGVSVTTAVQGAFTRAVDRASISDATFYLHKAGETAPVSAVVGFADNDRRVSLIPQQALDYGADYTIEATAGILDAASGMLQNPGYFAFATAPEPPLALFSVAPPAAAVGAGLVLSGQGFDPAAMDNAVLFNDVSIPPYEAGVNYFKVKVPIDAVGGEARIVSGGDTSNAVPFVVLVPTTAPIDEVVATVGTGASTKSVAVTPDGALAYSVSPEGDVVVPIDVEGQTSYPSISVGDNPVAIAIDPEGIYAYVCNFGAGSVSVIVVDPDSAAFNSVIKTITVGTNPIDLDINPVEGWIYIANAGSSSLSVIDGNDGSATYHQVVATVGTGSSAKSVAVTPDGTRIYVGTATGYVSIDAETNGVVATVGTGSSVKSVAITPDGALLIVLADSGTIYIYDVQPGSASENEVVATVGTGSSVKSVAVTPDGAMLYVIFEDSDVVVAYSLTVVGSVGVIEPGTVIPPPIVTLAPVDTIPAGSIPACVAFDPSGTGIAIICNAGDNTVTILNASSVPLGPLAAEIEVTPRTLNLQSRGRWVTGRIELPAAYFPEEIDIASVVLQQVIPAVPDSWIIEDYDGDGIGELVVKFDRATFQALLPQGEYVPVTIEGTARNRAFIGCDTIRTIRPVVKHPSGGILGMGELTAITWASPAGYQVDTVSVHWSPDDGDTWFIIAHGIRDSYGVPWQVPAELHDACRVMVTLFAKGEILGMGMSQDAFMIAMPVAVTVESFAGAFEDEAAVIRWSTIVEQNVGGFNVLRSERESDGFERVNVEPIPSRGSGEGASYEFRDAGVALNRTYYYKLEEVSGERAREISGPYQVVCRAPFALEQNVPNPFNPTTTIRFTIAADSRATLVVYDITGRRVKTLVDASLKAAFYRAVWDGRNENGHRVSSGIYFYRLQAGSFVETRKMIVLR